jgi:hypothetical protein
VIKGAQAPFFYLSLSVMAMYAKGRTILRASIITTVFIDVITCSPFSFLGMTNKTLPYLDLLCLLLCDPHAKHT